MKKIVLIISMMMNLCGYEAVIKVPVADLIDVGQAPKNKAGQRKSPCQVISFYADGKGTARLGQVLFNEVVEVLEEDGELVRIQVPNQYYLDASSKQLKNVYWAARNAVVAQSAVIKATLPVSANESVILREPYYVKELGMTLSAGTQLSVREHEDDCIRVSAYNYKRRRSIGFSVPESVVVQSSDDKRALFVSLVREIANSEQKTPYVWGGSSCIDRFDNIAYSIASTKCPRGKAHVLAGAHEPFSGFDCSGFIMRVAQMAGIPMFAKNSTTLKEQLGVLSARQAPRNGDIIFIPGHVCVVTDVDQQLIAEARSPEHGYGFVHEVTVDKLFEGVTTIAELHQHATTQTVCKRLNKAGECIANVAVSILPLATVLND